MNFKAFPTTNEGEVAAVGIREVTIKTLALHLDRTQDTDLSMTRASLILKCPDKEGRVDVRSARCAAKVKRSQDRSKRNRRAEASIK